MESEDRKVINFAKLLSLVTGFPIFGYYLSGIYENGSRSNSFVEELAFGEKPGKPNFEKEFLHQNAKEENWKRVILQSEDKTLSMILAALITTLYNTPIPGIIKRYSTTEKLRVAVHEDESRLRIKAIKKVITISSSETETDIEYKLGFGQSITIVLLMKEPLKELNLFNDVLEANHGLFRNHHPHNKTESSCSITFFLESSLWKYFRIVAYEIN
ncbi:MAG: hypothetical protein HGA25_11225 [Clostridiales bacterium]|nr:hypothetical protein [Clostridiales bacterium]